MYKRLDQCPICFSDNLFKISIAKGQVRLSKCECGVIFQNPRYVGPVYRAGQVEDGYIPSLILKGLLDESRRPIEDVISRRYDKIVDLTKQVYEGGEIADVGCGIGLSALALRYAGFDVDCYDTAAERIEWGTKHFGLKMSSEDIVSKPSPKRYALVTMSSMLEHVFSPVEFLALIRENALTQDGKIIITVPNIESKQFYEKWNAWDNICPSHFFYFSEKSLDDAARRAGFKRIARAGLKQNKKDRIEVYLREVLGYSDANLTGGIGIAYQVR